MPGKNETADLLEECRRRFVVVDGKLIYRERKRRPGERTAPPGTIVGSPVGDGYLSVSIFKKRFYVHRIIWAMENGEWPDHDIDHRHGNITDNADLRQATRQQNLQNQGLRSDNTSGVTGVSLRKETGQWYAYIKLNGRMIPLGFFVRMEDAIKARQAGEDQYFGEWSARRSRAA